MSVTTARETRTDNQLSVLTALGLVAVGAWISLVVLNLPDASPQIVSELWLSVVGAVTVGIGGFVLARRRLGAIGAPRWLRIGPLFTIYYTLVFGVFSLAWLKPQTGVTSLVEPSQVPPAVALCTIGLACWVIGYVGGAPAVIRRSASSFVGRFFPEANWTFRFPTISIVVYLIGFAARLYQLQNSQFGYLQNAGAALTSPSGLGELSALISDFAQFGLVMAALDAFVVSKSFRSRTILLLMLLTEISTGLFAGSKQLVVESLVIVGIVAVYAYGKVSKRGAVIAVLVILFIFPLVTAYRASIRGASTTSVATNQAATSLIRTLESTVSNLTPRLLLIDSPAQIADRLREIDNVAIIRQKTPVAIPYLPWTDLVIDPAVDWIPRILWSSKPVLSTGQAFSEQYYQIPQGLITASAVTIPGDLYRHGGVLPLCLGMFIFGGIMFTFDSAIDPSRDLRRLVLFVPLLVVLLYSEDDVTTTLLGILGLFIAASIAGWIAFLPEHSYPK